MKREKGREGKRERGREGERERGESENSLLPSLESNCTEHEMKRGERERGREGERGERVRTVSYHPLNPTAQNMR